jgi:Leucine-rich repeat (LRR) protein
VIVLGKGLQGLNRLQMLRLDFNRISQLSPSELGVCTQLVSLDLSSNQICSIAVSTPLVLFIILIVDNFFGC